LHISSPEGRRGSFNMIDDKKFTGPSGGLKLEAQLIR